MKKINFLWVILCILILSVGCKNGVSNSETQQTVTDPITGETVTTVPSENQDEEGTTSDSQTDNNENPTSGESENPTLGKDEEEVTDPTIPSGSILNFLFSITSLCFRANNTRINVIPNENPNISNIVIEKPSSSENIIQV